MADKRHIARLIQSRRAYCYKLQFTYVSKSEECEKFWPILEAMENALLKDDTEHYEILSKRLSKIEADVVGKTPAHLKTEVKLKSFNEIKQWIDPRLWEIAERDNWQVDDPSKIPPNPFDGPKKS